MSMRLQLWPQDYDAAGCYRLIFPAEALRDLELATFTMPARVASPDGQISYDLDRTFAEPLLDSDVYVLQQRLEKFAPDMVGWLQRRGKVVVCDADDYYEGVPKWNEGGRNAKAHPDLDIAALALQRKRADVVTCSTPFLAETYATDNPQTTVIRNRLDWRMWANVRPQYRIERQRIRVGWIGAAAWRGGDLEVLRSWFPGWIKRHPNVDFVAAGTSSEEVHDFLRVPLEQRITLPYLEFRSLKHPMLLQFDIGLVPLALCDFNEAKSHLKGLEYNAAGIPFVATPTESYRWFLANGGRGVAATTAGQWEEALDELVRNHELRRNLGKDGRAAAERHTIQNAWQEWADAWGAVTKVPGDEALALSAVSYGAIQKPAELQHLLALARGKRVIVEIGSSAGGTMWAFSKVAADDALIVSVDLPGGVGGGHNSHLAEKRAAAFRRADQRLEMIRGDSHDPETRARLVELLDGRRIDVLFIDGDHTAEGVRADWADYGPLADTVAFHDIVTHPEFPWCKVDELWQELIATDVKYTEVLHPSGDPAKEWGGIGIIHQESCVARV